MNPELDKIRARLSRLVALLETAPHLVDSAAVVVVMRRPEAGPGNYDCTADVTIQNRPGDAGLHPRRHGRRNPRLRRGRRGPGRNREAELMRDDR